jgi:hypothetical protein
MARVIGETTRYQGFEHPYLNGRTVRIVAVLKSHAQPEFGLVSDDYTYIDDELELELAGGVTAIDRLEVQPWIACAGRFSFAFSDARALDLDLFENLRTKN